MPAGVGLSRNARRCGCPAVTPIVFRSRFDHLRPVMLDREAVVRAEVNHNVGVGGHHGTVRVRVRRRDRRRSRDSASGPRRATATLSEPARGVTPSLRVPLPRRKIGDHHREFRRHFTDDREDDGRDGCDLVLGRLRVVVQCAVKSRLDVVKSVLLALGPLVGFVALIASAMPRFRRREDARAQRVGSRQARRGRHGIDVPAGAHRHELVELLVEHDVPRPSPPPSGRRRWSR
jgi:hypothetical protein